MQKKSRHCLHFGYRWVLVDEWVRRGSFKNVKLSLSLSHFILCSASHPLDLHYWIIKISNFLQKALPFFRYRLLFPFIASLFFTSCLDTRTNTHNRSFDAIFHNRSRSESEFPHPPPQFTSARLSAQQWKSNLEASSFFFHYFKWFKGNLEEHEFPIFLIINFLSFLLSLFPTSQFFREGWI